MDKMMLHRMVFYGYHGVFEEERKLGQRFIVDLELGLDLRNAGQQDDLDETINYAEVYAVTREVVEERSFQLIEAVAECIADTLLNTYTRIITLSVRVTKPGPPFAGAFDGVTIQLERKRE